MTTTPPRRYQNRQQISDVELIDKREKELREIFELAEWRGQTENSIAASFEIEGDLSTNPAVLSTSLDQDRIFDLVASFMGEYNENTNERVASATVIDRKTNEKIGVHITPMRILVIPREHDVSFQTFRDYVLYLENSLKITLNPLS